MKQTKPRLELVVPVLLFCWILCAVLLAAGITLVLVFRTTGMCALGALLIGTSATVMCCAALMSVHVYKQFCTVHKDSAPLYTANFSEGHQ